MALASVALLGAVGVASVRRVVAERNIARSERGVAELALTSAEKRKRELVLLQAETALVKDPTAALAWLKSYDVAGDDRGKIATIAWSPDAGTFAIGGHRPEILVVNAETGEAVELRGHSDAIYTLEFNRDGAACCRRATTPWRGSGTSRPTRRSCCAATTTTSIARGSRPTSAAS